MPTPALIGVKMLFETPGPEKVPPVGDSFKVLGKFIGTLLKHVFCGKGHVTFGNAFTTKLKLQEPEHPLELKL